MPEQDTTPTSAPPSPSPQNSPLPTSPASSTDPIDLADRLDATLVSLLALVDEQQQLRAAVGRHLNGAFFDLAQSKYVLGPEGVTRFQYDRRMRAGTTIHTSTTSADDLPFPPTLSLVGPIIGVSQKELPPAAEREGEGAIDGLRHRRPVETEKDSEEEEKEEGAAEEKPVEARDPLQWFGFLVPSHLRNAQGGFKKGEAERESLVGLLEVSAAEQCDVLAGELGVAGFGTKAGNE
ncbi:hypothetical protein BDK51DRAFT_27176 [Blyttiomyces helicus]|uniref:Vacuolar ATPase assembly protein VMA22 n=1 Tax=Blyttiomyces helicus TaxID=388810 RepID=A0A4V1IQY6_9FUNG|nr:hypothetical protein BDK51DRAFT_27176 [Blyttiomyces helicus]|eukprot:RKO88187.1 hypothetical protein BDK51DRAFT_27176 [Blyttiomyces helicus]